MFRAEAASWLPTFRDNIPVPSSRARRPKSFYHTVLGMRDPEKPTFRRLILPSSSLKQSTLLGVLILISEALRYFATSLNIYQSTRRYIPSRFESSRGKPTSQSPLLQHRSSAKIARPASQKFNGTAILTTALTQVFHYTRTLLIHLLSSSATRNKPDDKIFTSCVFTFTP